MTSPSCRCVISAGGDDDALAKQLGYAGFGELRSIFVGAMRSWADPFSSRAENLVARNGDEAALSAHRRSI